jgi:hypothetical protein
VLAKEGERRSGLSAAGGGVLQRCSGTFAGGGLVWCRGEQVRAAAAAVSSPHHGRARASNETEGDGRGRRAEPSGQAGSPPSDSIPAKFCYFAFARFCPEDVRRNARKKSKFKFSKFSNWVGHYIG